MCFHVPAHKQVDPAKLPGQVVHQVKAPSADFAFRNYGSVCVLTPLSAEGSQWVREHLPSDCQRWAGGYAIDHRCSLAILVGIDSDGLEVV